MPRLLDRLGWPEMVGLGLLVSFVVWAGISAALADRALPLTSPYVLTPAFLLLGTLAGEALAPYAASRRLTTALAGVVLVFAAGVLVSSGYGKEPLGYPNANAAAAVQLVALCGLALLVAHGVDRLVLGLAALAALLVVGLNRSAGGLVVGLPLAVLVLVMLWRPARRRWWAVLISAVSLVAGAAGIVWLAGLSPWPAWAVRAFDPVRQQLWHDALTLWRSHPVIGAGPGSFADATPLAVDPDTSTAHSSVLQVGSETGLVGVALLALVALLGVVIASRGPAPASVIAIAGWTALGAHSLVDHLLEFAVVVIAAGAVLGWARASTPSEELDVPERERPVTR